MKSKKKVKKIKTVNYVPFQLCPKCNGSGVSISLNISYTVAPICNLCNGAMVIPMAQIPSKS